MTTRSHFSLEQRDNQPKSCRRTLGKATLVLCLAFASSSRPARAQEIPEPSKPETPTPGNWYGWQILLADTAVIGSLAGGGFLVGNSSSFAFVPITGGLLYYSGGPLIHAAHGVSGAARKSFLRRLLVPLAPAAVGAAIGALAVGSKSSYEDCGKGCAAFLLGVGGFGLGMLGAMGYDWITATEPAKPSVVADGDAGWTPILAVGRQGVGVGLVMRF